VLALYYNRDILNSAGISQPPATWPELVNDVQKITRISQPGDFTRSGIAMGASSNVNRGVDILSLLMLQFGTKFYSDDLNSATFDAEQNIPGTNEGFNPGQMGLDFYTQFSNPAKTAYTWNSRSDLSIDAFTQGKLAMMLSYNYMIPLIRAKAPNLNWGVAVVPQTGEDVTKVNFANYWGLTVSKASPNADAAWDFLNFITQKEELKKYYALHKVPSSRKDILNEQISDPDLGVFAESALTARSVYKKDAEVFEGVFLKMIDDVTLRSFESQDALNNAAAQINLDLGR
jgi:multiple sugar transport system substrate-binding protein